MFDIFLCRCLSSTLLIYAQISLSVGEVVMVRLTSVLFMFGWWVLNGFVPFFIFGFVLPFGVDVVFLGCDLVCSGSLHGGQVVYSKHGTLTNQHLYFLLLLARLLPSFFLSVSSPPSHCCPFCSPPLKGFAVRASLAVGFVCGLLAWQACLPFPWPPGFLTPAHSPVPISNLLPCCHIVTLFLALIH